MIYLVVSFAAFVWCCLLIAAAPERPLNWLAAGICTALLFVQILIFTGVLA